MEDQREYFFVAMIAAAANASSLEIMNLLEPSGKVSVQKFLGDPKVISLFASVFCNRESKTINCLVLSNSYEHHKIKPETVVTFMKNPKFLDLSCVDLKTLKSYVTVITIPSSSDILDILRSSLNSLYAPAILDSYSNESSGDKLVERNLKEIKKVITELDIEFTSNTKDFLQAKESSHDLEYFSNIQTATEEISYWEKMNKCSQHTNKEAIHKVCTLFSTMKRTFQILDGNDTAAKNFFENKNFEYLEQLQTKDYALIEKNLSSDGLLYDCLVNVFLTQDKTGKPIYSPKRMINTMNAITMTTIKFIRRIIPPHPRLFTDPFLYINTLLFQLRDLLLSLLKLFTNLTSAEFNSLRPYTWTEGTYSNGHAEKLCHRFDIILETRSTSNRIKSILSENLAPKFYATHSFEPFMKNDPLNLTPEIDQLFENTLDYYNKSILAVDQLITDDITQNIESVLSHSPFTIFALMQKYACISTRPSIANLFKSIISKNDQMFINVIKKMNYDLDQGCNKLGKIVICRRFHSKAKQIENVCNVFKIENELLFLCQDLILRCKEKEIQSYDGWLKRATLLVANDNKVFESKDLLKVDRNGILQVNCNSRLDQFLRDTRQLAELGFTLPKTIEEEVFRVHNFCQYINILSRAVNFYNSVENYIAPAQRGILQESLNEFKSVVNDPKSIQNLNSPQASHSRSISWERSAEYDYYLANLNQASEKLKLERDALEDLHQNISHLFKSLIKIDFFSQESLWLKLWNEVRAYIIEPDSKYSKETTLDWMMHWNHQICKVINITYFICLTGVHEKIGQIRCELIYENRELQLSPSFPVLKSKYFTKMQSYIQLPQRIKGLAGNEISPQVFGFHFVPLRNAYERLEKMFLLIESFFDENLHWVALDSITMKSFVNKHCSSKSDFVYLSSLLRTKRAEIDEIPDDVKIDTCLLSTRLFKCTITDIIDHLHRTLAEHLHQKIAADFNIVDDFLLTSTIVLKSSPSTIEDIKAANTALRKISDEMNAIRKKSMECKEMLTVLLQFPKFQNENIVDMELTLHDLIQSPDSRWTRFEEDFHFFTDKINKQNKTVCNILIASFKNIEVEVKKFANKWKSRKSCVLDVCTKAKIKNILSGLAYDMNQLMMLNDKYNKLLEALHSFGMKMISCGSIKRIRSELQSSAQVWSMLNNFMEQRDCIGSKNWINFDIKSIDQLCLRWQHEIENLDETQQCSNAIFHVTKELKLLRKSTLTLKFCLGESFREDHWSELLQGKMKLPRNIRFENLHCYHFLNNIEILSLPSTLDYVRSLHARAKSEENIRDTLQEIITWSQSAEFSLLDHNIENRQTFLIRNWDKLFSDIGDKLCSLDTLKDSSSFKPFADRSQILDGKLNILLKNLQSLHVIQTKWVYLEPIFIHGIAPPKKQLFCDIDKTFREIMRRIRQNPKVFDIVSSTIHYELDECLHNTLNQIESCERSLLHFLEEKRSKMARFYFLSNDDLLELIGNSSDEFVAQKHIPKLFQAVFKIIIGNDMFISAFESFEGEFVQLSKPKKITREADTWLRDLVESQRETLQHLLNIHLKSPTFSYHLKETPSQVINLVEKISFVQKVEIYVQQRDGLITFRRQLQKRLQELSFMTLSNESLQNLKVRALIFDIISNRDVLDQLIQYKIQNTKDWLWEKQMRFYCSKIKSGQCVIRMSSVQLEYSFEYQGNQPKLIHTPLTEKCYLALTLGLKYGFGGNLYGPAGTGKTETVKSLGAVLGRLVLVFNCDESINFESMIRNFIGIVQSGSWGCFDEFNRLKEDQLSVISHEVQKILDAIKKKKTSMILLEKEISVSSTAAIFVTMNPASKQYGGRSYLPESLKVLLRPIAMDKPNLKIICEVFLFSEGFKWGKYLAHSITHLFMMSRNLLSWQLHYDWGLRCLKTILKLSGRLLKNTKQEIKQSLSKREESKILVRAIQINFSSKLQEHDIQIFCQLLLDTFTVQFTEESDDYDNFKSIVRDVMATEFSFDINEEQVKKVIQLNESMNQRTGCIVVGPSGCGKSTTWQILKRALIKRGTQVITRIINPKAMTRMQLFGNLNYDTREWKDGTLTAIAKKAAKDPFHTRSWVVCDGDIDPEWIESFNSVLDDNKILTLPNGERISFRKNVNFLFETHSLAFASPATISRMGIILFSIHDITSRVLSKWLKSISNAELVSKWLDKYFYCALRKALVITMVVNTTALGLVWNGLSHINDFNDETAFVHGLIDGLGCNMEIGERVDFAREVLCIRDENMAYRSNPLKMYYDNDLKKVKYFEAYFDPTVFNKDKLIFTKNIQRIIKIVQPWIIRMRPFILVGQSGCGISKMLCFLFRKLNDIVVKTIHCGRLTSPELIKRNLKQMCTLFSTRDGPVYRPFKSKRLIFILNNIDYSLPDEYKTSTLVSFLQHFLTYNGFYDEDAKFIRTEKIHLVVLMNPPNLSKQYSLSSRFTSKLRIGVVDYPDHEDLLFLNSTFISQEFETHPFVLNDEIQSKIVHSMVDIFECVTKAFSADKYPHYSFSPKSLKVWSKRLLSHTLESCNVLSCLTYEAYRLFCDKLVDESAKIKFTEILKSVLKKKWDRDIDDDFSTYFISMQNALEANTNEVFETNLLQKPITPFDFHNSIYAAIKPFELKFDITITLFPEFLQNLAKVNHALSESNAVLIGCCGSGKRLLIRLVCFLNQIKLVSPSMVVGYGNKQFEKNLKEAIFEATVHNVKVCFFVEEYHLTESTIFDILNSIILPDRIPDLYNEDELEGVFLKLKGNNVMNDRFKFRNEFFLSRIRKNFIFSLSIDPTSNIYAKYCNQSLTFHQSCNVVWIGNWRCNSLKEFCTRDAIIKTLELKENSKKKIDMKNLRENNSDHGTDKNSFTNNKNETLALIKQNLDSSDTPSYVKYIDIIVHIHTNMSKRGESPLQLIKLLSIWNRLYSKREKNIRKNLSQLCVGIEKIKISRHFVDKLSEDVKQQQTILERAQMDAAKAMEHITESLSNAGDAKRETGDIQSELSKKMKIASARKNEIEVKFKEIQPALKEAKDAIQGIDRDNLNEIRSLKSPPSMIVDVLSGVLMLLGIKDLSWISMKKFLGNRAVKNEILHFDVNSISNSVIRTVENLLKTHPKSFENEVISRVSSAAAPLAAWVKANLRFAVVMKQVSPLKKELSLADADVLRGQERLKLCENKLYELENTVEKLKLDFSDLTRVAEANRIELAKMRTRLSNAQSLLENLSFEHSRWEVQAKCLERELDTLGSTTLLSSAFIVYLGAACETIRAKKVSEWKVFFKDTNATFDFNFLRSMDADKLQVKWNLWCLPEDKQSKENACILNFLEKEVALIIDPEQVSTNWLKHQIIEGKERAAEFVSSNDIRFMYKVGLCVRLGKVLVITDAHHIDPFLYPLIRRDLCYKHNADGVVRLGGKNVDYSDTFRLFIMTRNSKIKHCTGSTHLYIINFTVTKKSLEGQILDIIVHQKDPNLEKEIRFVAMEDKNNKEKLFQLERGLIDSLNKADNDLLENDELIKNLSNMKASAKEINSASQKITQIREKIATKKNCYRDFAQFTSKLFFSLQQMHTMNNMYRYCLSSFLELIKTYLSCNDNKNFDSEKLKNEMLTETFSFLGKSIFKRDRYAFSLHLIYHTKVDNWNQNIWNAFIGNFVGISSKLRPDYPNWADIQQQEDFIQAYQLCQDFLRKLRLDNEVWSVWASSEKCEICFPESIQITGPEKLLLIKIFRPDRLMDAIAQYCYDQLGINSLEDDVSDLATLLEKETLRDRPILIITEGMDIGMELANLAGNTIGKERFRSISLGKENKDAAITLYQDASQESCWVCLKNLHLVIDWLPELDRVMSDIKNVHSNFKLWLTTEQHPRFPIGLLEKSNKITYEPPIGIKQNVRRYMSLWDDDLVNQNKEKANKKSLLSFILMWFHAVVHERNEYSYQGWTQRFEFNVGDLQAARSFFNDLNSNFEWEQIHYILINFAYGGRVNTEYDRRVLKTYIKKYFCEEIVSGERYIAPNIKIPGSFTIDTLNEFISNIPENDEPSTFGLPNNIRVSIQKVNCKKVLHQLKEIENNFSIDAEFNHEKWHNFFAPILSSWSKFKSEHKFDHELDKKLSDNKNEKPSIINSYLLKEKVFGMRLCHLIDVDLQGIASTVVGNKQLSEESFHIGIQLMKGHIPSKWKKYWDRGPENAIMWLNYLMEIIPNILRWVSNSGSQNILHSPFRLRSLFHPESLFWSFRLFAANVQGSNVKDLKMRCKWYSDDAAVKQNSESSSPELEVEGLLIQGAQFLTNTVKIQEVSTHAKDLTLLRPVRISFTSNEKKDSIGGSYRAPLYDCIQKKTLLGELELPCCEDDVQSLILAGVALFAGL